MALGPVLAELKRIHFFTHAATHRLTEELVAQKGIKEIVRVSVPVYQDAIIAALIFKDRKDVRRWATIGADYEYGYVSWNLFKETLKKYRPDVEFVGEAWAPFLDARLRTPHLGRDGAEAGRDLRDAVGGRSRAASAPGVDSGRVRQRAGVVAGDGRLGRSCSKASPREVQKDRFKGKLWATARYIHNWPDTPENKAFIERFTKRWKRYPNYSAETTYSAFFIMKAAVEKAGSLETTKVIDALKGMQIRNPAGVRTFRAEDQQFIYNVPAGRPMMDPKYPIPVLGDLKVFPAKDYYRYPPFTPVSSASERAGTLRLPMSAACYIGM